jgi:UDP-N-acetylmuramate: L-alanyl-gamma-D-glutamyl-meso-diaminopimelate ligase
MNLANEISAADLAASSSTIKRIFFYRICGTGMGACACLLKERGYEIEGADLSFAPPMDEYLRSTGIPLYQLDEVDGEFLKKYDLIVVGNSVPRKSDYARTIEECGTPFTSFPTVMGTLVLKEQNVIGLAGTHGKTTTTYFMTQILENLGKKPGYFIGGIMEGRPPSRLGDGSYFSIESDEYDSAYFQKYSKFRQYEINHMVLTSLEFDHADIFNDISDIEAEFEAAIPKIDKTFIFSNDFSSCVKLHDKFKNHGKWYLYGESSPLGPKDIVSNEKGSTFKLNLEGTDVEFSTNIIGKHNIFNISACVIFCLNEGFSIKEVQKALQGLKLVKRRQELRGRYKGAYVIDDFAHHPRAVDLTIEAIKQTYPGKEVVVVFDPISATARSNRFQDEFTNALKRADKVIACKPMIATTAKGSDDLDTQMMASDLTADGITSVSVSELEALRKAIDDYISEESVLLVLSNRTALGLWQSEFVNEIK